MNVNLDISHPMISAGFRYSYQVGQWYDPAGSDVQSQRIAKMESFQPGEKEILSIGNATGMCQVTMEYWHNGDCWMLICNGETLAESSYWNTYPVQLSQSGTHYHKVALREQLQKIRNGGGSPYPMMNQGASNFTADFAGVVDASDPHLAFFLAIARGEEPGVTPEEQDEENRLLTR